MRILGWDIGGANLKATLLEVESGTITHYHSLTRYHPIWRRGAGSLKPALASLLEGLLQGGGPDLVGATMTLEVADIFTTKREGVLAALRALRELHSDAELWLADTAGGLIPLEQAEDTPLRVASANWAASAWLAARLQKDCIFIDTGSTTTDIIPILQGQIATIGRCDLDRLASGELVYLGALRTNVAALVDRVPVEGRWVRVSAEYFATTGDVNLVLGLIRSEDYTTETADGRGRSRQECLARLSRVVCSDLEGLTEQAVLGMAHYIYEQEVATIVEGLQQVVSRTGPQVVVVAGLGSFLAEAAARRLGLRVALNLTQALGAAASRALPSLAVALMVASRVGVDVERWLHGKGGREPSPA
jgi:hypothetical protein